jgi:hypothetical protein
MWLLKINPLDLFNAKCIMNKNNFILKINVTNIVV